MVALMFCYNSMTPSTCKDDISANAICHHQFDYLFKELWDRLKGGSSSRSMRNLAQCCHKTGKYRALRNGSCLLERDRSGPPKMGKSWLIRGAAQYLGKIKEETFIFPKIKIKEETLLFFFFPILNCGVFFSFCVIACF